MMHKASKIDDGLSSTIFQYKTISVSAFDYPHANSLDNTNVSRHDYDSRIMNHSLKMITNNVVHAMRLNLNSWSTEPELKNGVYFLINTMYGRLGPWMKSSMECPVHKEAASDYNGSKSQIYIHVPGVES